MAEMSACNRLRCVFICTQYLLLVAPTPTTEGQASTNYRAQKSGRGPKARLCYMSLPNDQLDAQLPHFIIRLLQSSICFEQRRAHHQEVKLY